MTTIKSVEEKAKAYDEAVINGSKLWECGEITRENYEYIFPELKESEDDRIRGNIIATIHLYYGEPLEDEAKEMIAWLEKQGEHAKFRDSIQVGDKVTRNRDGMLVNLSQLKRVAKPAEKQGEHYMGISEATKQKLEDNLNNALEKETPESWNEFLEKQGEQKLDIKEYPLCKTIKDKIQLYIANHFVTDTVVKTDVKSIVHAMEEGVRLGQQEQKGSKGNDREIPNSAWSEEDEHNLNSVINLVHNTRDGAWGSCVGERIESWLKSLKERYNWKPSDEQMLALDSAIRCYAGISPTNNREVYALEIMKEQLKKLREE